MTTTSKGNYYLAKTTKLLQDEGYTVEKLEKYTSFFKDGRSFWKKSDMMFSDCLAYNADEIMFVQVKGGESNLHIPKAVENYKKLKLPKIVRKVIHVWRPRVKHPEVIEV